MAVLSVITLFALPVHAVKTKAKMSRLIKENIQDLFICLGDRYEMLSAVLAIIPFNIPITHFHGGEVSEGAIDEKFRHAITKLADYHFTSCEKYKKRVIIEYGSFVKFKVKNISLLRFPKIAKKVNSTNPIIPIFFNISPFLKCPSS